MSYTPGCIPFINKVVIALLPLALWLAPMSTLGQTQRSNEIRDLTPDRILEREMTGAETHRYNFYLQADEFFQVRVEQKGVDVLLRLLDASGAELARMDSPSGRDGIETLTFIAAKPGSYALEVSGFDAKAGKGNYSVWRESLRTATAQGRRRAEVERVFVEAMRQSVGGQTQKVILELEEALGGWQELRDGYMEQMTARQVSLVKANAVFGEAEEAAAKGTPEALKASLPKFESALRLYRQANIKEGEAASLLWLGHAHAVLGDGPKALECGQQALPLLRAAGDKAGEANVLKNMGEVYTALGEKQKALDSFNQALPLFRVVGETYAALGDDEQALAFVDQVLQLLKAVGDKGGEGALLNNIAFALASAGNKQKALEFYQQALPLLRAAGDKQGEAVALNNVGGVYAALGEEQKARDSYNESSSLLRAAGDKRGEASVLSALGTDYLFKGEYSKALDTLNQALSLFRAAGDKSGEATALSLTGLVYLGSGEVQKSVEPLDRALSLFKAAGDAAGEANALGMIGMAYNNFGEKQKALKYLEQALPLYRVAGAKADEAATLMFIGLLYSDLGELKKSSDYTQRSLQLQQSLGNPNGNAMSLSNAGMAQMLAGDMRKARDTLNQALPSVKTSGMKGMESQVLMNVGFTYFGTGEFAKGLDYLNQSLAAARAIGNKRVEANAMAYIGLVYIVNAAQGVGTRNAEANGQKALAYLNQALLLTKTIEDRQLEARTLTYMGLAVLVTVKEDDDERNERKIAIALDYLRPALPLAKATGDKLHEALALLGMSAAWYGRDEDETGAIFIAKLSVNKFQQMRHTGHGLDVAIQKDFLNDVIEPYRLLAGLLIDEERVPEAVQVLSLYQDEQFFDFDQLPQPARQVIESPREAAFAVLYERTSVRVGQVGEQIADFKRRTGSRQLSPAEAAQLAGLEAELKTASNAFIAALDDAAAAFRQPSDAQDNIAVVPEVVEMQLILREQSAATGQKTVALYTLIGDEDFYLILVTPDEVKSFSSSVEAAGLEQKILEFQRVLQLPDKDPRPLGHELYELIIKPAEADLRRVGARTLLWALDGSLRYVPVNALSPDGRGYLVERYQSVMFTRANRGRMTRAARPDSTGVGFGSSQEHRVRLLDSEIQFKALPGVKAELQAIFGAPPNDRGVITGAVFADAKFTKSAFYEALRARPPLVHISSHFSFRPGDDSRSFLLLGDGTVLTLNEMKKQARLFDGVELLTLSACNTAVQRADADGREIDGFAELAQRLGASSVIATLWPVSDKSTSRLMSDFYSLRQRRPADVTNVEALRQSQLALLNGTAQINDGPEPPLDVAKGPAGSNARITAAQPVVELVGGVSRDTDEVVLATVENAPPYHRDAARPYAHPYYWSPFVLFGNWR